MGITKENGAIVRNVRHWSWSSSTYDVGVSSCVWAERALIMTLAQTLTQLRGEAAASSDRPNEFEENLNTLHRQTSLLLGLLFETIVHCL